MVKIYWFAGHEQFQPEVLVRHAQLAEETGFDGVMVSDHFHPWVDDQGAGGFAFATLGAIAIATHRIDLMTAVTTPLFRYHPAVVAQAAATVDRLSGGRFALGLGSGENLNEGAVGHRLPPYQERAARLEEAVTIIRRLLAGGKVDFSGRYYQTEAARLYSPPVGKLSMYLAAAGPKTAVLAGREVDGVLASVKSVAETKERVVQPAKTAAGTKPFRIIANRWTVFARTHDEAWRALGAWRGLRAPSKQTAVDPALLRREADKLPQGEILARYTLTKSAEDYLRVYQPLVTELGADIVGIQTTSTNIEQTIRLLGSQVLPELRKL